MFSIVDFGVSRSEAIYDFIMFLTINSRICKKAVNQLTTIANVEFFFRNVTNVFIVILCFII